MRFLFLLIVFLFNIIALPAQSVIQTNPDPAAAGFDKERLTRLDNYFKEQIEKERAPGIAVLIVRNGKVAYHKAFGYNDDEKNNRWIKMPYSELPARRKPLHLLR